MAGIQFPLAHNGRRSTTVFHKAVLAGMAESLSEHDLAQAIRSEEEWRRKYVGFFDALVKALHACKDVAQLASTLRGGLDIARAVEFEAGSTSGPLATAAPSVKFQTVRIQGTGAPKTEFQLPYEGKRLVGAELESQCDAWAAYGTMETDCADAIKKGARRMADLRGRTFLVLGAGAELGPVRQLLEAGATVAAVATRRRERWADLVEFARCTAGTLLVPVAGEEAPVESDQELAAVAGADLLAATPAVVDWLIRCGQEAPGKVTLGTYLYADGEANLRLTVGADLAASALADALGNEKMSFAYLGSSWTSFAVPAHVIEAQKRHFATAGLFPKIFAKKSACSKLECEDSFYFLSNFIVLQGPNYALAQTLRQWRAVLLHIDGFVVSSPIAPNCRTVNLTRNPTLATLLKGVAHWAPMETFDPETGRAAMLAILLHDLAETPPKKLSSPMQLLTRAAFHSGIWRCPFDLRSLGTTTYILGKVRPLRSPL